MSGVVNIRWFLEDEHVGSESSVIKNGNRVQSLEAETDIKIGFGKSKKLRIVAEFDPPVEPCE